MPSVSSIVLPEAPTLTALADAGQRAKSVMPQNAAKVADDFESLFSSLILKEMRKTLEPNTLFGNDSADVYGGLFDLFLGQQVAQTGGLGIGRMVRDALARNGAGQSDPTGPNQPTNISPARETRNSNGI